MTKSVFPSNMTPLLPFFQGAEVYGEVSPKTGNDGEQKTTQGVLQWTVPVIVPFGRLATEQRVTVVANKKPALSDGDRVQFVDLHVGAYSSGSTAGIYLWATQAQKVGEA